MRCITSEPVPWLHMMGRRPAIMVTTVIILGRRRRAAPWITARCRPALSGLPLAMRSSQAWLR
ncbi:hypothetical protein D3C86_1684040 [compost metagenome]